MLNIKTVTILGANGSMGAHSAGIIAGFGGAKIFMVARDLVKAQEGINTAKESIKSDTIDTQLVPKTYDELEECVSQSDWVFECAAEDMDLKQKLNKQIASYRKPGTIVSTVTSGLSITELSKHFDIDGQKHYFGTHFFNPPYKMLLCELISNPDSDPKIRSQLSEYLSKTLHRVVVETKDTPGFAGNRIGLQFLNEAAIYAQKYGISYIDKLLGGIIGHTMPPLATIDLIGLDVHTAIINNLLQNTQDEANNTFKTPPYIQHLISQHNLGNKTGGGLFKQDSVFNPQTLAYDPLSKFNFEFINQVKAHISKGLYSNAYQLILSDTSPESEIIRYFMARYISYSLSLVGTVVKTKEDVDLVMSYGFGWLPPSALVDLLTVSDTIKLIKKYKFTAPKVLFDQPTNKPFYTLQDSLDYRTFIRAN